MTLKQKISYAIASGVILSLGWPGIGSLTPLLFIGLIPIMLLDRNAVEEAENGQKSKTFWFFYLAILIFNILTTWWVWNASPFGAIMAIILNTLFLTIAIQIAHFVRKKLGNLRGDMAWIFLWIGWEYFHLDWDLSWTWLILGNGFANTPYAVQWYEFTGVFGGSLWVIGANLFFTKWIVVSQKLKISIWKFPAIAYGLRAFLWILIPLGFSLIVFFNYEEETNPSEIVVVQPNIDPYNEKFDGISPELQLEKMLSLAAQKTTKSTEFVVLPETALPQTFDEAIWNNTSEKNQIEQFLAKYPKATMVIGASTFVVYHDQKNKSATARVTESGIYYDVCNTAIGIKLNTEPEFYHKSKLVPGVEKMPFPGFFQNFQSFAFDLGGAVGSQGSQENREVFESHNGTKVGPIICYESIYGEFVGEYVTEGADLLFIITNDGWWGNTPGFKQHALYAQLRSIEHRRSIARSANTGTSCFIDQRGITSQSTEWWVPDVISASINKNTKITFYSEYGDILGRLCAAFGALIIVFAVSRGLIKKGQDEV